MNQNRPADIRLTQRQFTTGRASLPGALAWAALVAAGAISCTKPPPPAQAQGATEQQPAPKAGPADAAVLPEPVQKFVGRWVRSDGGYILEVFGGDRSGVLKAGYFNPKPINVSRAIWMQGGGGHQIVVELNDVGYPGATYILSHDAKTDRLVGQYNQPQMQQTFDIEFIRQGKQ